MLCARDNPAAACVRHACGVGWLMDLAADVGVVKEADTRTFLGGDAWGFAPRTPRLGVGGWVGGWTGRGLVVR